MALEAGTADTVHMRLLERESPLESLAEYAADARRGHGRLVLVAGEAGVGKSALAEKLREDLPAARWSWGSCDGLFTPRPLGPLFDLAGQLGGELAELCRARASREELFSALLREVARPGTLDVLVLEDVHWADEATIDLLRFLGRRLRDAAVLVIATYRDDGLTATEPLRVALGDLAAQRSTRRIGLAPLSMEAVRILAGASDLDAAELYQLTGGNPFYLTEVLQTGLGAVPVSARDVILARAAPLGRQARELLDVAALSGTRVELRLVASAAPCSPAILDELLASGLLAGDGGWLKFRHEIARLAVEQAVPAHRRAAIHARILGALVSSGCDDDARTAFHAEAAADAAAVLRYAPRAARRAVELASHREAAAQYERTLRFAAGGPAQAVAGLYDELARELALIDRWHDAAEAGEQALSLWRQAGDRRREGDTLWRLSRTMWRLCRGQESAVLAERALVTLEPLGPSTELAWAYASLASNRLSTGASAAALALAQMAQAVAGPLGEFEVLSNALNTEGCAAAELGQEWTGLLNRALELAISHGLEEQAGRAYSNLDTLYCHQRRFAEAERYFTEGLAYCEDHDISTFANCLRGGWASALEQTGRWDEAVALSRELLRHGPSPINQISPLLCLGIVAARRGEDGVWELLDEAVTAAAGTGEPVWITAAQVACAEAHWLAGNMEAGRRAAELADDKSAECDAWERGAIALWLRRTGSDRPPRGSLAEPYQVQLDGRPAQAAGIWTELRCPFEAAMAFYDAAAEATLRQALSILATLRAPAVARVVRQRMRLLGIRSIPVGPRTSTRAHPLQLTRREHEVLDLICAGCTNSEIAARLFIAAKTVDHHVGAVLAKLGAPSRTAAASRAARLGLVKTAGSPEI